MAVYNPNCTINGNTCAFNGEEGISGSGMAGSTMTSNYFAYNNVRNWSLNWDAAGVKICNSSNNMTIAHNLFDTNNCNGLWYDLSCSQNNIVSNIFLNNVGCGIKYEYLCTSVTISDNLLIGNATCGTGAGANNFAAAIMVGMEASNVQVWNNTLSCNYTDILIADDQRYGSTNNVVLKNNIFSNGLASPSSTDIVNVLSYKSPATPASSMNLTFNYNAYYRTRSSNPATLVDWSLRSSQAHYTTRAAFYSATGNEANGIAIDNVGTNPFFVNESVGNYALVTGSPAINAGTPLPTDIATAIGVTAGTPVRREAH